MISKTIGFRGLAYFQTHPFECLWLSEHIRITNPAETFGLLRLVDSDEELVDIMPFWSPVLPGEARP